MRSALRMTGAVKLSLPMVLVLALGLVLAGPARAQAPPAGGAQVDPASKRIIYVEAPQIAADLIIGYDPSTDLIFFVHVRNPLQQGAGCFFPILPTFQVMPALLLCPSKEQLESLKLVILLAEIARNRLRVAPNVPVLPGPNLIQGGKKQDVIQGGQSDERINTGKGNDTVDPGKGKDEVNTGAGKDKIDSRDGEKDTVNGGKGKNDKATVDKKLDKVKNVEKVKRK